MISDAIKLILSDCPCYLHFFLIVVILSSVFTWRLKQAFAGQLTNPVARDFKDDVWVIHGKRYDLTPFLKLHPGGSFALRLARGSDCTGLFETYHVFTEQSRLEAIMKKYELSDNSPVGKHIVPRPIEDTGEFGCPFHEDLKKMCREHFNGQSKSAHKAKGFFMVWHVCVFVLMFYLTFRVLFYKEWYTSIAVSLCAWHLIANVGHEASHFAYSTKSLVNRICSAAGWPYTWNSAPWHMQHVAQHHVYTNSPDDIDLYHFLPFVRLSKHFEHIPIHRLQPLVFLVLLLPTAIGHLHLAVPFDILWGTIDPATKERRYSQARNLDVFRSSMFWEMLFELLLMPALVFIFGLPLFDCFCCWCTCSATTSVQFLFVTQVTHLQKGAFIGVDDQSWAKRQVAGAYDYCQDSLAWSLFTGGLNMQALHHVLPSVSSTHYADMYPKFREICKKHDVKIKEYSSAWETIRGFFAWICELSVVA
jgi:fatty acid desaturase|eukprot:TRINITY_DN2750_c1_g1_i1.p1 TRINITY_DN2750_c1_g1~~TRINITY_DN2750_c1_g1_i1.p1  ORF type:complete len:476 (+),score=51.46 TRINITY_DN2750_c1_g1_i1:70-1497(+)